MRSAPGPHCSAAPVGLEFWHQQKLQSCLEGNFAWESFCPLHMHLHFKNQNFHTGNQTFIICIFVPFIAFWGSITSVYVDLYSTSNAVNYLKVKQHITRWCWKHKSYYFLLQADVLIFRPMSRFIWFLQTVEPKFKFSLLSKWAIIVTLSFVTQ